MNNFRSALKLENIGYGKHSTKYRMRVMWTSKTTPAFGGDEERSLICNIPTYLRMSQFTLDEMPWKTVYIRVHDSSDFKLIEEMLSKLKVLMPSNVRVKST